MKKAAGKLHRGCCTLLIMTGFLLGSGNLYASGDTLRVLFVGNSYTYTENLAQIVSILSEYTPVTLITRKSTLGGAYLREHWHGLRGLRTRDMIASGDYDVVVLQDFSMNGVTRPDSLIKYVKLFSELIRESGAQPCLFQTWARKKVPQYQQLISQTYLQAADAAGAWIAPVGEAWERAIQLRPGVELYHADGTHPNALGTLLTACVFTGVLTGEVPEKAGTHFWTEDREGETILLMNFDNLDVDFCLRTAREILNRETSGNYPVSGDCPGWAGINH